MENTPRPSGSVAANVRRLRRGRNWSLADLSHRLHEQGHPLSVTILSKMELGDRRIDVDDLVALALALGVDSSTLLTDPDLLGSGQMARLWADHSRLTHARRVAIERSQEEIESIDGQLEAIEKKLLEELDGRPDLQVVVLRAAKSREVEG